jgi:hypothetical protein
MADAIKSAMDNGHCVSWPWAITNDEGKYAICDRRCPEFSVVRAPEFAFTRGARERWEWSLAEVARRNDEYWKGIECDDMPRDGIAQLPAQ